MSPKTNTSVNKADLELPESWEKFFQAPDAGQRALPPSINVMADDYPVYQAPPSPAVRPGALDYQRVASLGHRC